MILFRIIFFLTLFANEFSKVLSEQSVDKWPTVLLAVIARNEDHTLPHYLGYLEELDYPKERISIYIQSDHNEDNTGSILKTWSEGVLPLYKSVEVNISDTESRYTDSDGKNGWSTQQYIQLMHLRQNALSKARQMWADYILFVDCDNFLMNKQTLKLLIKENKTVISPMLTVYDGNSGYSNFWGAIDESGYYKRSTDYFAILKRELVGCLEVPMIHSTLLINLNRKESDNLTYFPPPPLYNGELDDILIFAYTARTAGVKLFVVNKEIYGKMLPANSDSDTLADDKRKFTDEKIEWIAYNDPFAVSKYVKVQPPPIDNLMFDKIFLINLERRKDRRDKMLLSFETLGISPTLVKAVDGRKLTPKKLDELGIKALEGFTDPYWGRPLTMGEVGCFLSHYNIWKQMADENIEMALVLEDDVRFQPDFKFKLKQIMNESISLLENTPWDLIYVGRKVMHSGDEPLVQGSRRLVWANYSYWTLGYILRLSGAKKLLDEDSLKKMIPVDEYIPVKFNSHTNKELLKEFNNRNVKALSTRPLLIYPTHYVGDSGYISDTEATLTIKNEVPVSTYGEDIHSTLAQDSHHLNGEL